MCTVIIANHHHKDFPLVIAANRDKDYNRPSSPVQILDKNPLILGGRDKLSGGTWLAVNEHSLFVAITNQGDRNPKFESRGLIVLEALKKKTIGELLSFVEEINPAKYNKFNIIFGNNKEIYLGHSYLLHSMVIKEMPNGVHIVNSNMKFNSNDNPTVYHIHQKLDPLKTTPWLEYYKILKHILASSGTKLKPKKSKDTGKLSGLCTVSSSILTFSDEGLIRYKFHDRIASRPKKKAGEPFVPRYKDYIDLWRNPDGKSDIVSTPSEEHEEHGEEEEDISPKEAIMEAQKRLEKMTELQIEKLKFGNTWTLLDTNGQWIKR
jgi:uncharacterized protein with NRDE domain